MNDTVSDTETLTNSMELPIPRPAQHELLNMIQPEPTQNDKYKKIALWFTFLIISVLFYYLGITYIRYITPFQNRDPNNDNLGGFMISIAIFFNVLFLIFVLPDP